jgi:hypothetical protein
MGWGRGPLGEDPRSALAFGMLELQDFVRKGSVKEVMAVRAHLAVLINNIGWGAIGDIAIYAPIANKNSLSVRKAFQYVKCFST